jgi:lipopolysaccharide transport system ATP-binding protein
VSEVVIKVENLSKKYILRHQQQERYTALRDVMSRGARNLGKKLLSPFTSHVSPFTASEDFYALKNVSFEINQGDRVGIIVRNGAGKTTLLKILTRITEPTSGRMEITGRVASLLEVGTGFHPELTGRENIYLNGAILGMKREEIRRKLDEIVVFAEVDKFLDIPVKHYSSGMYMRLAFAVAAHIEPEIMVVDEVLAVGDAQFQNKCLGKMQKVSTDEGRTVLFVSHNMNAIQKLCSHCIILDHGCLLKYGNTISVVPHYLSLNSNQASARDLIVIENKNHLGSRCARFVAIQFSSLNENLSYQPYTNGPLEFLLTIEANAPISLSCLAVDISDKSGIKLINADIGIHGQTLKLNEGKNIFNLRIEKLYLHPGTYVVSLYMEGMSMCLMDKDDAVNFVEHFESLLEFVVINPDAHNFVIEPDGPVACHFELIKTGSFSEVKNY